MQTPDVHAALLPDRLEERRQRIRERVEEMQRAGYSRDQALYGALEEAWRTEALENDRLWDQADEIVALKGCLANFALRDIAAAPGSGLDTVGLWS